MEANGSILAHSIQVYRMGLAGRAPSTLLANIDHVAPWEASARLSCSALLAHGHQMILLHVLCSAEALHAGGSGCGQPACIYKL